MLKSVRLIALAAICSTLISGTVEARYHPRYHSTASHHSSSSDYYTAHSGHRVHRPIQATRAPSGASARCRDDSWSFSESRRGTWSHHGGVARWL
jgi:hypothetical protein